VAILAIARAKKLPFGGRDPFASFRETGPIRRKVNDDNCISKGTGGYHISKRSGTRSPFGGGAG